MIIKGIIDEDFINYRVPSMVVEFPHCNFKCDKECGRQVCQNSELAAAPAFDIYAEEIVALFRDDADVIVVGATAFRWQLLTYPLGAVVMYSNMMMQTIRKPIRASILSAARQGIFFIPAILIMPQLFGIQGVEATQAVADLLSFLLAIPLCGSVLRELN